MIVIALQQDGTASVVSPLKLYQGTDTEKIVVLSPFSPLNALQIGFVKPDGTSDGYVPMKRIELPEEYASVAVSAWVYLPNVAWTAKYGDGYINILALLPVDEVEPTQEETPANYGHLTSFMCQVTIQEALLPNLPNPEDAVTQNAYDTILEYLAAYSVDIETLQGDMEQAQEDIGDLNDDVADIKDDVTGLRDDVDEIKGAYVKGVKGSAESEYRHGDVSISKEDIGLGNVDNTSDMSKPVSTAQQAAINTAKQQAYAEAQGLVNAATLGRFYKTINEIIDSSENPNPTIEQVVSAMREKSQFIGNVGAYGHLYPSNALGKGVGEIIKVGENNAAIRYQEYADPYWGSLNSTPFGTSSIQTFENGDYIYAYGNGYFARYNKRTNTWSDKVERYLDGYVEALCVYGNRLHYISIPDVSTRVLAYVDFDTMTNGVVSNYVRDHISDVVSMCEDESYIYLAGGGEFVRYNKATEAFPSMSVPWTPYTGNNVRIAQDADYVYVCYYGYLYFYNKGTFSFTGTPVQIADTNDVSVFDVQPIVTEDKVYMYPTDFSSSALNKIYVYTKASGTISTIEYPLSYASTKCVIAIDGERIYVAPYSSYESGNTVYYKDGNAGYDETSENPFQTGGTGDERITSIYAENGYAYLFGVNGYFTTYRSFRSAALWVGTVSSNVGWSGWTSVTGGEGGGSGTGDGDGTFVYVGGERKDEINFTSDPQTQINNRTFNRVYKSIPQAYASATATTDMQTLLDNMYDNSVLVSDVVYNNSGNVVTPFVNIKPEGTEGINGVIEIEKLDAKKATAKYTESKTWDRKNFTQQIRVLKMIEEADKIYQIRREGVRTLYLSIYDKETKTTTSDMMLAPSYPVFSTNTIDAVKIGDYIYIVYIGIDGGVLRSYIHKVDVRSSTDPLGTDVTSPVLGVTDSKYKECTTLIHFDGDTNIYQFGGGGKWAIYDTLTDTFGSAQTITVSGGAVVTDDITTAMGCIINNTPTFFLTTSGGELLKDVVNGVAGSSLSYSWSTASSCKTFTLDANGETPWLFWMTPKGDYENNSDENVKRYLFGYKFFYDASGNPTSPYVYETYAYFKSNDPIVADANDVIFDLIADGSVDLSNERTRVYATSNGKLFTFQIGSDAPAEPSSEMITQTSSYYLSYMVKTDNGIFFGSEYSSENQESYLIYTPDAPIDAYVGLLKTSGFEWSKLGEDSGGGDTPVVVDTTALMKRPLYEGQKVQTIYFNTDATIDQVDAFLSKLTPTMATGVSGQNEISTIFMTDGTTVHGVFGIDLNKFSAYGGSGYGIAVCEATSQSFTILDIKYVSVYSAANQTIIQNFPGASGFTYTQAGWQGTNTYTLANEETIEYVTPNDTGMKDEACAFVSAAETEMWGTIHALPSAWHGSNPNLLINSNFAINQRGQSSYTGSNIYSIDRWKLNSTNGSVTVTPTATGVSVATTNSSNFWQELENYGILWGKTVTYSASINGSVKTYTVTLPATAPSSNTNYTAGYVNNIRMRLGYFTGGYFRIMIDCNSNLTYTVEWAKLEIGSVATTYTPPIIAEELPKCQRYYNSYPTGLIGYNGFTNNAGTSAYISINLPVKMRTVPTLTVTANGYLRTNGSAQQPTAISIGDMSNNVVAIICTATISAQQSVCLMQAGFTLDAEIY